MFEDERPEPGRTLSVRLDVQLDAQPITGRLRTDGGADEQFIGWLGFIDTLRRLSGPPDGTEPASDPS